LRKLLQDELLQLWQSDQRTVLFITHSLEEAILLGDRVIVMSARPGTIVESKQVPFGRPRDASIREAPEFAAFEAELWEQLRVEVERHLAESMRSGGAA
jgi:NitT/TauT family transport system ATP-binding protein